MTRRSVLLVLSSVLFVFSLLSSVSAEVLFGPVTVTGGQTHTATFPMYCRCTSYFVEVANVSTEAMRSATIILNGQVVMEVGNEWTEMSRQVELREDGENEIEIEVWRPEGSGVVVQVYERDVTPAPMVARDYVKVWGRKWERFGERFVLNHWASRFHLVVENGDPDGSHRVTSGQVWVNGVEVIGTGQLHSGVASVSVEVGLQPGENDIQALLLGPTGRKIRIGIEEPAQTVTVTEVAEVEVPFSVEHCGVQMHDGHLLVRVSDGNAVVDIDETGSMITRLPGGHPESEHEKFRVMSPRGGFVWTDSVSLSNETQEWVYRFYDRDWNMLHESTGELRRVQQIADAGNVLLGYDLETIRLPACSGAMVAVYNASGSLSAKVPQGNRPSDEDVFNQLSPDGLTCWAYCNGNLQVWGTAGMFLWEAPWRQSRHLGNGGIAVQATEDSLLFHGLDGTIVRRVVEPGTPGSDVYPLARSTPYGHQGLHVKDGLVVANRYGPQSCWRFRPETAGMWTWFADDGKWVLSCANDDSTRLIGAGGGVLRRSADMTLPMEALLSQNGEYFALIESRVVSLYRLVVE